jgi:diguanylate cyclase (GGDEF)-like protein
MGQSLHVLIIDHASGNASLIVAELSKGGFKPVHKRVENAKEMQAALEDTNWDLIISADDLPDFNAFSALRLLAETDADIPFILISGGVHEDFAVETMKRGACDYILKGNLKRLVPLVERELREAVMRHERIQDEEQIKQYRYYDAISNLPNRTLFCEHLQKEILASRRNHDPFAVLIIKINQFQQIRNALGSVRGDQLLQHIGQRLKKSVEDPDTIAHLGGTTFATFLPESDVEDAIRTAKRLLVATESPFTTDHLPISVTGTIGIARCPEHGSDPNLLIQRAEIALHSADQLGSGYSIYQPEMNAESYSRLLLMGRLAGIIDKGTELFLQYQPQVEIKTMRLIGVEALVRWQDRERGLILPDQFISATEQTGLIHPLTTWLIKTALQQYRVWQNAGLEIVQAVNISARSLQDLVFPYHLTNLIHAQNGSPEWLQIEITEGAIMANPSRAMNILTQLNAMGISLSMDDFGTGYSSLGRLKDIPVDEIKIDQCFVKHMRTNHDNAMMVRSMIDLIHNLGRIVLAEGVEDQETWDMLARLGCDRVQGYFVARPMNGDQIPNWLKDSPYHAE